MNILITGCGGMLGEAVYKELRNCHNVYATDIDRNEEWLHYLDVRRADDVKKFVEMVNPGAVLHLAALTDMEYCELNPVNAYDTNFVGTHNVLQQAKKVGAQFVYISSAGVFDGKKLTYVEGDVPNPLNVYAKSKYAGELVVEGYEKGIIIRAGWMMGGGPVKDKKFVNKIMKQIRGGSKQLCVVGDKLGTPTYTYELAKTIRFLFEDKRHGVFHGACDGGGSRVDVAWEMIQYLGLEKEVQVKTVYSDYFSREYFAVRPYSEKLISSKLDPPPDWQTCLQDYMYRFEWMV